MTASIQAVFGTKESEAWIPFVRTQAGLVALRGAVNGKPVLALLDTGAPYTAIDAGFARENGIKLRQTVTSGKGRVAVWNGDIDVMRIGPIAQLGGRLAAIDLSQGKRIEVEALQGSVVRRAARAGVPVPIISTLYALLKPYAAGPLQSV